jgi:nucleoside 2-deoxyribosyltransferase
MKPTIYLAGPISGLKLKDSIKWRNEVREQLSDKWHVFSPSESDLNAGASEEDVIPENRPGWRHINCTSSGLVTGDEFLIRKSDWLLVNLRGAEKVSLGSMWEMGFAWGLNKQIITVIREGERHDHPFVRRRSHVFVPDLPEAVEYLRNLV